MDQLRKMILQVPITLREFKKIVVFLTKRETVSVRKRTDVKFLMRKWLLYAVNFCYHYSHFYLLFTLCQ